MSRATEVKIPALQRVQRRAMRVVGAVPGPVRAAVGRLTKVNADGDRLAPEMALVGVSAKHLPGLALMGDSVSGSRRAAEVNSATLSLDQPPFAVEEDLLIDGPDGPLGATRYRAGDNRSGGLILFLHGGGFVIGSRASHDGAVRALALASGADVLSVDYRLAPEHRFPAAVDDVLAAWRYAVRRAPDWGVDPHKIVVAGDSAGGNLAAVLSQQLRGEDVVPCLQLLIYPVVDLSVKRGSMIEFADGFYLTAADIDYFADTYLDSREQLTDPRASPLLADDLSGLPPAHVVVAGFDPLRDEGLEYARALTRAGVPVTVERAGGMIHGFMNMLAISPAAQAVVDRVGQVVADSVR